MDKVDEWLERISQPPKEEVANLDYWDFLLEARIAQATPQEPNTSPREPGRYSSAIL